MIVPVAGENLRFYRTHPAVLSYCSKALMGNSLREPRAFIYEKDIIDSQIHEDLDSQIFELINRKNLMSYSQLPNNAGIVIRILSDSIDEIDDMILVIRQLVRKLVPKSTMKITQ